MELRRNDPFTSEGGLPSAARDQARRRHLHELGGGIADGALRRQRQQQQHREGPRKVGVDQERQRRVTNAQDSSSS